MHESAPAQPTDAGSPAAEEPRPLIRSGLLRGLLFLVVFVIASIIIGMVMLLSSPAGISGATKIMESLGTIQLITWQAITLAVMGLIILFFRKVFDRRSFVSLGFSLDRQARWDLLAGLGWGIAVVTSVFLVLLVSGMLEVTSTGLPGTEFLFGVILFVIVALHEELVSRGYLLNNFMQSMNPYLALLLVSVLFSLGHGANPNVSLVGLANIVLAGLFLGIYYVHRKNLWFPIGVHFTWNLFQGHVLGSPVSGVKTDSILKINLSGDVLWTGGEFGFEASLITTIVTIIAIVIVHLKYRQPASDHHDRAREVDNHSPVQTGE